MNPNSEIDRGRLFKAMQWSYEKLRPFRSLVHGLVLEYAGSSYAQPNATRPRYEILANLLHQTVDVYTMSLVANCPRVSVVAREHSLKQFAKQFTVALNKLVQEKYI